MAKSATETSSRRKRRRAPRQLGVRFEGWFQVRMASDPDPTDEPRGVSGCTFALVGEPDLDRIIRFQAPEPALIRSHSPPIGVRVVEVAIDGKKRRRHPLLGAEVDLANNAKFVEMNGVVVDRNTAFIDPLVLRIRKNGLFIQRAAVWDPDRPATSFYQISPEALRVRQPQMLQKSSNEVREAMQTVGISPKSYVSNRLRALRRDLRSCKNALARAGIEQRIHNLELTDWRGQRLIMLLTARVLYSFALNAKRPRVKGRDRLGGQPLSQPWPLELWLGGWDNDTLCGYARGRVIVPVA